MSLEIAFRIFQNSIGLVVILALVSLSLPVKAITLAEYEKTIDYTCQKNSDCVIKDIGNCCGHYPVCTNVKTRAMPELMKNMCLNEGMASVCGYNAINRCECVSGRCEGLFDQQEDEKKAVK